MEVPKNLQWEYVRKSQILSIPGLLYIMVGKIILKRRTDNQEELKNGELDQCGILAAKKEPTMGGWFKACFRLYVLSELCSFV